MRSVDMDIVPWPLSAISTRASLGQVASQPHTDTERELHKMLLNHRRHEPGYDSVRLFQEGLDGQSNFVLRLMHLREGDEMSAYAIVRRVPMCSDPRQTAIVHIVAHNHSHSSWAAVC